MGWIEQAPLWLIALVMLAGLIISYEIGFMGARRVASKHGGGGEEWGHLVSSALALLGLLMAFTFSAAQDRYRLRQELVVDEANAISTTYLRFQLLDEPWRDDLSRQMLQYTQIRVGFAGDATPASIAENAKKTAAAQEVMWRDLAGALRANATPNVNLGLINSVNETFDLAETRRAGRETRVPPSILYALILASFMVAGIVGYATAGRRRHVAVTGGVMVLLTLAFILILDLDRPTSGTVQVNQVPMDHALEAIRQSQALAAPAPAPAPAPAKD
jgi:hypothetical protein